MPHEDQQALADIERAITVLDDIATGFREQVRLFGEYVHQFRSPLRPAREVTHDSE